MVSGWIIPTCDKKMVVGMMHPQSLQVWIAMAKLWWKVKVVHTDQGQRSKPKFMKMQLLVFRR